MTLSTSELKAKQLESCPSKTKIAIVILNYADDPVAKATFYNTECTFVDENGVEHVSENRYRYSALLDFNETLVHDYGAIRILRLFPPKKWVGNKEGSFVQQRMEQIQKWLTEIVEDEELCEDQKVRDYFHLSAK
jgi:hypothetical protein